MHFVSNRASHREKEEKFSRENVACPSTSASCTTSLVMGLDK